MRQITEITLLTILLCIRGCGDNKQKYPVPPSDAKAESFVSETRQLKIGSETYDADYGTITVPENRSKSASRLISIPFLRVHSNSKNPAEPIFALAGGPGESNMTWDWGKAATFLPGHNFVLVGYRGVDGSTLLECPEVKEAFKQTDDLLGEESIKNIGHAWVADAESLKSHGIDLDGYSMLDCIEDNESVRKVLKYERIDLLSESYGTRVAYLYALKHQDHIFRSAMISVNPPGHFDWQPRTIDAQLKQYAALWSEDSAMSKKNLDLYATVRRVLNAMPNRWLLWSINPGKVRLVTFVLLFHRNTAAQVFDAYVSADRGDPSGLALMSLAYDFVVPSLFTWGDLASKAVSADFDSTRNYTAEMESSEYPLGSPLGKVLWGSSRYGRWPMQQLPVGCRTLQNSDVQTLLLSGSIDFSTPAEFATKELLPYLRNGKQVILSECGHVNDVWYVNPENTRLILTSFYNTGVPNTSLNKYVPMNFSVGWGFPAIFKMALGVIALMGIALVVTLVWLIRKCRKWMASEATNSTTNP